MVFYDPDGNPLMTDNDGNAAGITVDDDSFRQAELMGDDCLMLRFSLAEYVDFPLRCRTVFGGQTYCLFSAPEVTKQHNRHYDYSMPMYTAAYLLHTTLMRNVVTDGNTGTVGGDFRLSFPLTARPLEHLKMVADCLNIADSGWTAAVADDVEDSERLVSYEFVYCDEALQAIAEAFGTEYEIVGRRITLGKVEHNRETPLWMSYGKGNGFVSGAARRNEGSAPAIDRLYIQGGEQNIPAHYGMRATVSGGQTTYSEEAPDHIRSGTLLLPKGAACFYGGGKFWFSRNPTVRYGADGTPYVQAKDYRDIDTGLPIYETLYDDSGNGLGTTQILVPTPCFLVSSDGRSLRRVRHTFYDPDYVPRNGCVEAHLDLSEIYPMRVGQVDAVASVSGGTDGEGNHVRFYDIYDAQPGCPNYRDCSVDGETMTVIFQDGMLAGREFDLNTYSDGPHKGLPVCEPVTSTASGSTFVDGNGNPLTAMRMELCQSEQDGLAMPGGSFVPRRGDHYIVFHCSLPEEYIGGIAYGAEYRALREAAFYLYHHGRETFTFSGEVDVIWAKRNWDTVVEMYDTEHYGFRQIPHSEYFAPGQHIKVTDVHLFGAQGLVMRVTGVKQPVNNPKAIELVLTNALTLKFNWVGQLSQTVRVVRRRPPALRPEKPVFPHDFPNACHRSIDISPDGLRVGGRIRQHSLAPLSRVDELSVEAAELVSGHNSIVASLAITQRYFDQIRLACNRMRELIALNSGWSGVTYNASTHEITGIQEVGDGGGGCVEGYGCAIPYTDIEVPDSIVQN